ncbi:MAG: gliding motility-associated C-terminal domain-containing protein [Bacteroidia bacterium]|jgi:gliding motility-associated-like protein
MSFKKLIFVLAFFAASCIASVTECLNAGGVLYAQSVGGTTSGANTYCTTTNSGFVTVSGYVGNILNWQSSTNGGLTWNSNANTTPNQTYFNLNQTTCYRAIVQDGMAPPDTSTIVCITIYPESIGGSVSGGGTYCAVSGSGTLTLSGHTGSVLNWMSSTDGGTSWTTITNVTTTYNYSGITESTLFAAVVQSNPACPSDTSSTSSFVVSPLSGAGAISGATTLCETSNSGILNLIGYTGTVTGWESSIDNGVTWNAIGNTSDNLAYVNLSQSTIYQVIVQSGICAADTTPVAVMNVSPATVAGTVAGGDTYCGIPATGTLTLSGYTGSVLNWLSSTNNGTSWTTISNTTDTENYTNLPVTTWYSAVVQSGACAVDTSAVAVVSVAPQTVAGTINSNTTVCTLVNEDTLVLTGNVGNVIGWLSSADNGVTWVSINNTTALQPYSGLTQTTLYAAIVQSGSCDIDTTAPVTLTVVSLPVVDAGDDVVITQGGSITLTASGTGSPLWFPATGLSSTNVFSPIAGPSSSIMYVIVVTDSNNCINADTVQVTVLQNVFDGKVSNLFTPNGDGLNDKWYIEGIQNYPDSEVFVYNIYGSEVFRSSDYVNDWQGTYNGSDLPDGTYYYVIVFKDTNMTLRGSVNILRSK